MKSAPKKRTPSIANLTVKRRYLTEREVDRLMDCARKYGRYRVRPARPGSFRPSTSQWGAVARHCPIRPYLGWFVVAAAFAATFVDFGSAYTSNVFVESLQSDFAASRHSAHIRLGTC